MFEIDTGLMFWTVLSFGIMVVLLYLLVFPAMQKMLNQRRDMIEGGIERAKKAQAEAQELLKKYERQLAEADKKVASLLDEAKRSAQVLREATVGAARKEAYAFVENTKKEIEGYKDKTLQEIKHNIASLMVNAAGQLIGKSLQPADQDKLVDEAMAEIGKNEPGKTRI
jgi:F-type H+-transporting ATPase subunit b